MRKDIKDINEIIHLAKAIRKDVLSMTYSAGANGGHIGGALSSADILAVLYGAVLNSSPENPTDVNRDRFILSKGHISLALYAALAECGYIPKDDLLSFEQNGSSYQTHSDMNVNQGIEISSGSLGYGLSMGVGCALSAKMDGRTYRTFVLLGDGECNEGVVWEAAIAASHFKLNNLIAIVDVNGQQLDGYTADVMPIHNISQVFNDIGFQTIDIDGHNIEHLINAFSSCDESRPTAVIAHTIKGKGIRSIENKTGWHHARITKDQFNLFSSELEEME